MVVVDSPTATVVEVVELDVDERFLVVVPVEPFVGVELTVPLFAGVVVPEPATVVVVVEEVVVVVVVVVVGTPPDGDNFHKRLTQQLPVQPDIRSIAVAPPNEMEAGPVT